MRIDLLERDASGTVDRIDQPDIAVEQYRGIALRRTSAVLFLSHNDIGFMTLSMESLTKIIQLNAKS